MMYGRVMFRTTSLVDWPFFLSAAAEASLPAE
jgi:hypothetical protein